MDANSESPPDYWPPKNGQCEMPELKLTFLSVFLMIHRGLGGGGPKNGTSYALVMNYVRIVDKLVIDYNLAREQMVIWAATPNEVIGPLLVAIGHFESCVSGAVRAIDFARRIRKDKNGPGIVPKGVAVLSDAVYKSVNDMRNSVEHLDGDILDGTLSGGVPICLVVRPKAIELAGAQITFAELADWITQLHAIADKLAYYRES